MTWRIGTPFVVVMQLFQTYVYMYYFVTNILHIFKFLIVCWIFKIIDETNFLINQI